jgi:fructosamine-3-kinase
MWPMPVLLAESQRRHLEQRLGSTVRAVATISGGDINDAYRITLADGRRLFVKTNRNAPPDFFAREAAGLAFLEQGLDVGHLRVPEVILSSESALVLELLELGPPSTAADERLGRGLAHLHRASPGSFGLAHDNYIGTLVQPNRRTATWAEFYGQERLLAQARLPEADRLLDRALRRRLDRLVARLDELVGEAEEPARVHGDLWGGNWLCTTKGPFLVDPAAYGGHREVDLAMMRLFGGFSDRVFEAYEEVAPLASGHLERVSLYQLYPLLVHVNLFGAGYLNGVSRILGEYG